MNENLDWGIASMKAEIAEYSYAFNRQQDFNEWLIEVYLTEKTSMEQLNKEFELYQSKQ